MKYGIWRLPKKKIKIKERIKNYAFKLLVKDEWDELFNFLGTSSQKISDWKKKLRTALPETDNWKEWGVSMADLLDGKEPFSPMPIPKVFKNTFPHKKKNKKISRLSIHNAIVHSIQMF